MNKRQRKKWVKREIDRVSAFLRDTLKPCIGEPITPTQLHRLSNLIGNTLQGLRRLPALTATYTLTPILRAPFRQWRFIGREELTHHVGATFHEGHHQWTRFCDYVSVEDTYLLSHATQVTCLQCIAREPEVMNSEMYGSKEPE